MRKFKKGDRIKHIVSGLEYTVHDVMSDGSLYAHDDDMGGGICQPNDYDLVKRPTTALQAAIVGVLVVSGQLIVMNALDNRSWFYIFAGFMFVLAGIVLTFKWTGIHLK